MPTRLLTGMPRCGTTLVCAILNEFPDTLALGEPLLLARDAGPEAALDAIDDFVAHTRARAVATGLAMSKHVGGAVPDNWVEDPQATGGTRRRRVLEQRGEIAVGKTLSADFDLVIKHPAEFTGLADTLRRRYPLYALVRNPLAVLASWQTVEMPVHHGHMPMLECFVPGLTARLDAIADRLHRQVALMRFLLGVYARLPPGHVLRYEDVIADPAGSLRVFSAQCRPPLRALAAYDPVMRYPAVDLPPLARALRPILPAITPFYPDFPATLAPWLG